MARPKSNDKRNAILDAAARVIVAQGLSAPTATIAKVADVSNGSLFTYFETKADLFNQLYIELKVGMATVAMEGFPKESGLRDQAFHIWSHWMTWAAANPEKQRALTQLSVSDQITPETRAIVFAVMADLLAVMERIRMAGALRDVSMDFVGVMMGAFWEATMNFIINDPENAGKHSIVGFEMFWRAMS